MGCGKSAAEDDYIDKHHQQMEAIFHARDIEFSQKDIENTVALLFMELEKQQLNKRTWELMDKVRRTITRGTPENLDIYYLSSHYYRGI